MPSIFWALLVLFLFGALLRMDWVYYLAYVVGGVWLYTTWSVRRSVRRLVVARHFLDHAFVGQTIPVRVAITNTSRLPIPWLRLEERVPLDLKDISEYKIALSVGGKATTEHLYTLACKRRGYYALGPLSLRTGDLFGFSEARWEEDKPRHVTVYPAIVPLESLGLPSRLALGGRATRPRLDEDPARLSGVRPYAGGDSTRRIHWKASAHADTLLVKKFQPGIGLNVMVAVDMARQAYTGRYFVGTSEWTISVAASVAGYIASTRQPVGLLCCALDAATNAPPPPLKPRSGQGQLITLLSTLARAQLWEDAPAFDVWLAPQLAGLEWGTALVVITPHVSEQLLWVLHQATRRGATVTLLLIDDQLEARTLAGQAHKLGIAFHKVQWEKDLQNVHEGAAP
jgi:uncharacterized protein (DUF58 family)